MSTDLEWFKSSYSSEEGECVEVANGTRAIHVRDSKDTTRPALALSPAAWTALIETVRRTA
ncbi:DUF397 domain-containing protein [Streptomyces sp. NBC_01481]|uniref:DUF397 domain-containing protein n=1 Tax=Streptomyces sp. NBC_01481 TaxID=2975869 RepID=UPI002254B580|nr:DUF397 domain-containing protein [Streptomyces sp. NBC_01481]MCX4584547.1 DUF397 domain-containing protein [Streptomyces sp. NBC_01481]